MVEIEDYKLYNAHLNNRYAGDRFKAVNLDLPEGNYKFTIEAISKPGKQVMDYKHLGLERQCQEVDSKL